MKKLVYKLIKTQEQYEEYCDLLDEFLDSKNINDETQSHIELLLLLVKDWDKKQYDGIEYDPIQIIKSLLEEHELNQKQLARILNRSESHISEILNYKKYLSKEIIRVLARYFKINQEALNKVYKLNLEPVTKIKFIETHSAMFLNSETYTVGEPYKNIKGIHEMSPKSYSFLHINAEC